MSWGEIEALVNMCKWATVLRPDGSSYRFRASDCGRPDCKWSDSYVGQK